MTKFVFTADHGDGHTLSMECEVDYLENVIENFEMFLRGSGFVFDGDLTIVGENKYLQGRDLSIDCGLCPICKLTDEELGNHYCYDKNCPKMV